MKLWANRKNRLASKLQTTIRWSHFWWSIFIFSQKIQNKLKVFLLKRYYAAFQYCQPAQNQPKSQFLFHKNYSPRNFDFACMWAYYTAKESWISVKFNELITTYIYSNKKTKTDLSLWKGCDHGCEILAVWPVLFYPIPMGQTAACYFTDTICTSYFR